MTQDQPSHGTPEDPTPPTSPTARDDTPPGTGHGTGAIVLSAGVLLDPAVAAQPSHEGPAWVCERVSHLGFAVSEVFAGSFSATGPVALFTTVFPSAADRIVERATGARNDEVDLPVTDLSAAVGADLDRWVAAVFFQAAPDFGPGHLP